MTITKPTHGTTGWDTATDPLIDAYNTLDPNGDGAIDAGRITSGTIATARLGSGTANSTTTLHGDGTWSAAGGSGYATVQDEGSALTARGTINFAGAGVTATDDAANSRTLVTIPGGSGGYTAVAEEGSALTARGTLNFVGRPVTAADNAGSTRTDVTVQDTPAVHAVGNSSTALTIDVSSSSGPVKTITLNGNCTLTLTAPASGRLWTLDLFLTQDATGGRTVTWPASVKWAGGAGAPTLSTAAGAKDWITLSTPDAGTTWYAAVVGKAWA